MTDYKSMYFSLFGTITDAIELLKKAQEQGERIFIEDEDVSSVEFKEEIK